MARPALENWPAPSEERLGVAWTADGLSAQLRLRQAPVQRATLAVIGMGMLFGLPAIDIALQLAWPALPPFLTYSLPFVVVGLGVAADSGQGRVTTLQIGAGRLNVGARSAPLADLMQVIARGNQLTFRLCDGTELDVATVAEPLDLEWLQLQTERLLETAESIRAVEPAARAALDELTDVATGSEP